MLPALGIEDVIPALTVFAQTDQVERAIVRAVPHALATVGAT